MIVLLIVEIIFNKSHKKIIRLDLEIDTIKRNYGNILLTWAKINPTCMDTNYGVGETEGS